MTNETAVASFTQTRVGAVSPAVLSGLGASRVRAILEQLDALDEQVAVLRPGLEEGLFAAVPSLDDAGDRRVALRAKRDVHNGRAVALSEPDVERLLAVLPAEVVAALDAYRRTLGAAAGLVASGDRVVEDDLNDAARVLSEQLDLPDLQRALPLASPTFARDLAGTGGRARLASPASPVARTATGYVTRAAVKPSPFSSLAGVGLAGAPSGHGSRVRANPGLDYELLQAAVLDPSVGGLLELEPAVVFKEGQGLRALLPARMANGDYFFRVDRSIDVTVFGHHLALCQTVARATADAYRTALQQLDPEADAHRTLTRLVQLGLLRPVVAWSQGDDRAACLAGAIAGDEGHADRKRSEFIRLLIDVGKARRELETAGTGRTGAVTKLADAAHTALQHLGAQASSLTVDAHLAHEDVTTDVHVPGPTASVVADLREVGGMLRPRLVRSRVHQHLVELFVRQFGVGGACDDVVSFLVGLWWQPDFDLTLARWGFEDLALSGADAPTEQTADDPVTPSVAVFYQVASSSSQAVDARRYRLVVNSVLGGAAALASRYVGLVGGAAHEEEVTAWLEALHAPAPWHPLSTADEWSLLMGTPWAPRRSWPWPADVPRARSAHPTGEVTPTLGCVHDVERNALRLLDDRGQPVGLSYLGVVPAYLYGGPLRLLLAIVEPSIPCFPLEYLGLRLGQMEAGATVERLPRIEKGRVVLRRAMWRVPVEQFPRRETSESVFSFLARVRGWRRELGLPEEVFLRVDDGRLQFDPRRRKPMWVRFDSPHTLAAAAALVSRHGHTVVLAEALPSSDEHWVVDNDGRSRAVEYVSFISWPSSPKSVAEVATSPAFSERELP